MLSFDENGWLYPDPLNNIKLMILIVQRLKIF